MIETVLVILLVGVLVILLLWAFQKLIGVIPLAEPLKGVISTIIMVIVIIIFVLWAVQRLGLSI